MPDTMVKAAKSKRSTWVVLIYVGVLLGGAWAIAYVNAIGSSSCTKESGTRARIAVLSSALELYHAEYGAFPRELSELAKTKMVDSPKLFDKWRRPLNYRRIGVPPDDAFILVSPGADGQYGSPDDIARPIVDSASP